MQDKYPQSPASVVGAQSALTCDVQAFRSYLDGSELTDAEERVLLETLWSVVVHFVDFGMNLSPLQAIINDAVSDEFLPAEFRSVLCSEPVSSEHSKLKGAHSSAANEATSEDS